MSTTTLCVLLISCLTCLIQATPFGAPASTCVDMTPQHGAAPQTGAPPYSLTATRVNANQFTVTLQETIGAPYKGFLIQARAQGSTTPLGFFEGQLPEGTQFLNCGGNTPNSVTHSSNANKDSRTFTWNTGGADISNVRFVATTCLDLVNFWLGIESAPLSTL